MLEWVISSAVLTLIVIALRFVLKGKTSLRLQYALWALVLIRLLVPFSCGSTGISIMNTALEIPVVQDADILNGIDEIELCDGGAVEGYQSNEIMPDHSVRVANGKSEAEFSRMKMVLSAREIFTAIWGFGSAVMFLVLAASNAAFKRKLKRGRTLIRDTQYALPVYISEYVETPCLFGLFCPAIYVTPEAAADDTVLRHSIQHELTHFRHADHLWSLLRGACLALHWYDPLVWWAAVLSRNDAELACDESTIKRIGENERAEYGRTLIEMTCQKRPALLLTATTMTGSKSSIKERIMMIAKKPKTAICTLIAVILIVAVAAGCTFTGAESRNENGPWLWAQAAISEQMAETDGIDTKLMAQILNGLEKDDFSLNKIFTGTDGADMLIITYADEQYPFLLGDCDAVVTLEFDGAFWDIASPELFSFVMDYVQNKKSVLPVKTEVDDKIPAAVIDYATDYTKIQLTHMDQAGNEVTEAEIVGLTQVNTGTAWLDSGINMYLLEYRFLAADPDEVILAGGAKMEGDYITEWGSTGQPYLLLHWEREGDETFWDRICVTDTVTMLEEYSTPEMLEQYGNMYTAAAMELYSQHISDIS